MLDTVQEIHKTVGKSLLSIRKNHPESQVQVYTTIDQVSKLCDLSKKQYSKRKLAKSALLFEKEKMVELKNKVELVAQKMQVAEKKISDQAAKIVLLTQQKEEAIASLQKNITLTSGLNRLQSAQIEQTLKPEQLDQEVDSSSHLETQNS